MDQTHKSWCASVIAAERGSSFDCDCREDASPPSRVSLPVLNPASHAATTAFCAAEITNPDDPGRSLWVDGNGKITRDGGTFAAPAPNAFSLVQVDDCPGSTPTCRSGCYVAGIEAAQKEIHDRYRANSALMHDVMDSTFLSCSWALALARWIRANTKSFRWHVSGDLFSRAYAAWVASVVELAPDTDFWIYTRSFQFVVQLSLLPNLSINLSADVDNYPAARAELEAWRGTATGRRMRIAYYTRDGAVPADLAPDSIVFPDYALRGTKGADPAEQRATSAWWQQLTGDQRRMTCPVDFYSASEDRRCGPCGRCL